MAEEYLRYFGQMIKHNMEREAAAEEAENALVGRMVTGVHIV